MDTVKEIRGVKVLTCGADGARLEGERDIGSFLGDAWAADAGMVAIPVARISADFFKLSTRLAGEVAQKFVNYRVQLAIIGDISPWLAESKALRDFVYESNRGQALWFLDDMAALEERLAPAPASPSG
ncbi:DUF4180 domain-containing protein [Bosea caraganae]|uniref:DUF4180 domain-containing protein n=1 Tax=Bosea caraganae TaxID=2763117 RepID=A0A370L5Y9_9HYPH|nr:DUF4180 domain-containing protein [Bosea caraganae]RDJ23192.1 DUF4180 domain-containing protein [Bosea caraganae]RDJ24695.1 DUF4180 domain-containing protein [Bosea caraganae]